MLNTEDRTRKTKDLALQIRQLPAGTNKVRLAYGLAGLSTEGDFGHDTLQEITTTLSGALHEHPLPATPKGPPAPYVELAQLVPYERVNAALDDPQYASAVAQLDADDAKHKQADFSLVDLQGRTCNLKELRGKLVLVNFWSTWCPPCRSEMPDLEALYNQFKDQGLVVLGISDEDAGKVKPCIDQNHYRYPEGKLHKAYSIEGIPKSFIYDREGKLVAQAIDMRTRQQFMEMPDQAGLK
jgi:peroxiredoxin